MAHSQLSTVNPVTKYPANFIMQAFIINKNRPSVTIVTGKVSITKSGFIKKFKRLNTIATIIAVV